MSLLVVLAQVKLQLKENVGDVPGVTKLISWVNDDLDIYSLLARELGCPRSEAQELFRKVINREPALPRAALSSIFFELYPELREWYDKDKYYPRYRP